MGAGQRTQQRRVVGLRSAGGEVAIGLRRKPGAPRHHPDHVRLERHGGRRGRGARDLRIERGDDPVGALRRKTRAGVEKPEIARVRQMDDTVLEHADRPVEQLRQRTRHGEVEAGQFAAKRLHVERRHDRAGCDALLSPGQLAGQIVVDPLALRPRRKQRFGRAANRGTVRRRRLHASTAANAPSSASHSRSTCDRSMVSAGERMMVAPDRRIMAPRL